MNRFLTCTAVGLFLGLSPALAEPQLPADEAQTPPAVNQPSQIPEVMPDPAQPSDPAAPIPGDSSQVSPSPMQPGDDAAPPAQSSEAPLSIEPAAPKAAEASGRRAIPGQAGERRLACEQSDRPDRSTTPRMRVIGDINDLVTDQGGKIVAVLIGSGGFLGLGEKDVARALRGSQARARRERQRQDHRRSEQGDARRGARLSRRCHEQKVTVGSTKGDREDAGGERAN